MDNISSFNKRIDQFITKYYKVQISKGLLLVILLTGLLILFASSIEYFSWFNSKGRFLLFVFSIISFLFIFYYFFGVPILRYLGLLKKITEKDTERLLREKLPEIKDFVNTIFELKNENIDYKNDVLVTAALNQKIEVTNKFDFNDVIKFNNLSGLLKYLIALILTYGAIFLFSPDIIVSGSKRIINFNKEYIKNLGYRFSINEKLLIVEKGDNLNISIRVLGETLPGNLSIFIGVNEYLCKKVTNSLYEFELKSINNPISFRVGNDYLKSKLFDVKVLSVPFLKNLDVIAEYPKYLNKGNDDFTNITNFKLPIGTNLTFNFTSLFTDTISYFSDFDTIDYLTKDNKLVFSLDVRKSHNYFVEGINQDLKKLIIPNSNITVIPDMFPDINVISLVDKKNKQLLHYKGIIGDDYGFTKLNFNINCQVIPVVINTNLSNQEFYFSYEFDKNSSEEIVYFFEVFDNDGYNGIKSVKSQMFTFKAPNYKELNEQMSNQEKEIYHKMEKSLLLANEFKKDIQSIREKLFSEKLSSFEKNELIKELNDKQNSLEKLMNELSEMNNKKNNQFNSFSEQSKELLQKQEQIQKLLESIMDEDLKKLLDELNRLADELNKDELNSRLEDLDKNYDKMSKELDKNLELLKKYEIERDIESIIYELDKIADSQKKMAENLQKENTSDSLLLSDLKRLKEIEKEYNDNLSKNEELENSLNLENFENEFEDLKKGFDK
nr:hypothetical protein [Bacteroidales bacterium]